MRVWRPTPFREPACWPAPFAPPAGIPGSTLEEMIREAVTGLLSTLAIEHTLQYRARRATGGQ